MKILYKKSPAEGAVVALEGIAKGAENYARGKRQTDAFEEDKRERDRQFGRQREHDVLAQNEDRRRDEDQAAQRDLDQLRKRAAEQEIESNDWAIKRQQQEYEDDMADRQVLGQNWRGTFGEDPPDEIYGPTLDGESGLDPRSDIPIDVQKFMRDGTQRLEAEWARAEQIRDPKTQRAERARIAQDRAQLTFSAKEMARAQRAKGLEARIRAAMQEPAGPDGKGAGAEADPYKYLPAEMGEQWIEQLGYADPEMLDDISTGLDKAKKANEDRLAFADARALSIGRMDELFTKVVQRDQQFGDMGEGVDPADWERARQEYYAIVDDTEIHGEALRQAERRVRDTLLGGGNKGSKSQSFSKMAPEDRAFEVWQKLPEDQRTPDELDRLTSRYAPKPKGGRGYDNSVPARNNQQWPEWMGVPGGEGAPTNGAAPARPAQGGATPTPNDPQQAAQAAAEVLRQRRMAGEQISFEDGKKFVQAAIDGVEPTKATDEDLQAERHKLSIGYVSDKERARIKEIDKRMPERKQEAAKEAATKGIDEQFLRSAIERLPSTREAWIDDVQRVRDLITGKDGYSEKARRLLKTLESHGKSKGWELDAGDV